MEFNNKLIYVGDPMCSWCWGISNDFEELTKYTQDDFETEVLLGGLRPGTTLPMDEKMKDFIRHHWDEVAKRTGQLFNFSILEKDVEFIYDTEVPSRAVIIAREIKPELTFNVFRDIQQAFYEDNKDTNKLETYLPLIKNYEIDENDFIARFNSEVYQKKSYEDFALSRKIGVTGFPTVILGFADQLHALALGYAPFEKMKSRIDQIKSQDLSIN